MKKNIGKLIILTGINGAGKDTVAPLLVDWLAKHGHQFSELYGPKATAATTALRELVLSNSLAPRSRYAQALVWFAQHAETAEHVRTRLEQGENILLNRGPETALNYNILSRGLEKDFPALLNVYEEVMRLFQPDVIVTLDIDVETSIQRSAQQGETDHFQEEGRATFQYRREIYLELAERFGWRVIDARSTPAEVTDRIGQAVMEVM